MEEGSFRCDANVSIRPEGSEALGIKIEIKNLNSFKAVEKSIEFEIERQRETLLESGKLIQETRLWDEHREETRSMIRAGSGVNGPILSLAVNSP